MYSVKSDSPNGPDRHPHFFFTCTSKGFEKAVYDADTVIAGEQDALVPSIRNYYLQMRFDQEPASRQPVGVDKSQKRVQFPARIVRDFALHKVVIFQFLGADGDTYTDKFISDGLTGSQLTTDCGQSIVAL